MFQLDHHQQYGSVFLLDHKEYGFRVSKQDAFVSISLIAMENNSWIIHFKLSRCTLYFVLQFQIIIHIFMHFLNCNTTRMVRVTKISVVVNLPLWRGEMERKLFVDIPWYVIHVIHQSKCPRVYLAVLKYPPFYQLCTTFNGKKIISEVAKDNWKRLKLFRKKNRHQCLSGQVLLLLYVL